MPKEKEFIPQHLWLPIAGAGVGMAATGLIRLLLSPPFDAAHPPRIQALGMALFAGPLCAGAIYGLRKRPWKFLALVGLILALLSPPIFARQSIVWRKALEEAERKNVLNQFQALRLWSQSHQQQLPGSWQELGGLLAAADLQSPYRPKSHGEDYLYLAKGLKFDKLPPDLMLICSREAHVGDFYTIAFADGSVQLIDADRVRGLFEASNAARVKLGQPPLDLEQVFQPK